MTRPPLRVTRGRVPDRDLRPYHACAVLHPRRVMGWPAARAEDLLAAAEGDDDGVIGLAEDCELG